MGIFSALFKPRFRLERETQNPGDYEVIAEGSMDDMDALKATLEAKDAKNGTFRNYWVMENNHGK